MMDFYEKIKGKCKFNKITWDKMDMMNKYFDLVDYKACEYNFMTLFMWQHNFNTHVMEKDNTMYVFGKDNKGMFSIVPISINKRWERDLEHLENIFNKCFEEKIVIRSAPKEYVDFIKEDYPGRFKVISDRDSFDYLYDADSLKTLSGRKYHSKKNHFNAFMKEYGDRFEYRRLSSESEFEEVQNLMKNWANSKGEIDETMEIENEAVKKVLYNYDKHRDLKIGSIYIDGKMEAFTFATMLRKDTVQVHTEKANAEIRGLYAAINKIFLEKEYPDVSFVNREDDLGLESLRKAKLSYKPIELVEKYTLIEI